MRYIFQGNFQDQSGNAVNEGTVSVVLAGASTPASIYAALSGGAAVNSVESNTAGVFRFYVDTNDYNTDQLFDVTLSKTDFASQEYPNVDIYPDLVYTYVANPNATDQGVASNDNSIADLIAEIGSNVATILCNDGTYTFTTSDMIPVNITLKMIGTSQIAGTLAFSGNNLEIEGSRQVFASGATITGLGYIEPQWWGVKGDGSTDDFTNTQRAWNSIRNVGGHIHFPWTGLNYCFESALLFQNTSANTTAFYKITGDHVTFNFFGSGITSSNLVTIGADSNANAQGGNGDFDMSGIRIIGTNTPGKPTTTTGLNDSNRGLFMKYCYSHKVSNVYIAYCDYGLETQFCFSQCSVDDLHIEQCWVGHWANNETTNMSLFNPTIKECGFAVLLYPEDGTKAVYGISYHHPNFEGGHVGVAMDPNDQGTGGRGVGSISFTHPYMENITGDYFRLGLAVSLGNTATIGGNRDRHIQDITCIGGLWASSGGWNGPPIPIRVNGDAGLVTGINFQGIACLDTDIVNLEDASNVNIMYSKDPEVSLGSGSQSVGVAAGETFCSAIVAGGAITSTRQRGGVITWLSTGKFRLTFETDYIDTDEYIAGASIDIVGHWIVQNRAVGSVDIWVYNQAGPTLTDPTEINIWTKGMV
jgi:hypothetical protein